MVSQNPNAALQSQMQNIRENLSEHADEAMKNARREFDWRTLVAKHPWTSIGVATALGYFLVPRRASCKVASAEAVTEAVDRVARAVQPSPLAGMVTGVLTAVTAAVAREALGSARGFLLDFFSAPRGESPARERRTYEPGMQSPGGPRF